MRRKTIILSAFGMLLVSSVAFTMRPGQEGLAQVERADVVHTVVAPGVVEPVSERISLSFELGGTIAEMYAGEGERVTAGQVLARLDDRLARAKVARAAAALEAARARRDAAVGGSRKAEIEAAQADVAASDATARAQAVTRDRLRALHAVNAVSAQELDDALGRADASQAAARAAEARLVLIKEGLRSEARREAQAAVDVAAAKLEEAQTLLAKCEIRAPIDAVVLRRMAEPGEQISTTPPEVVFVVADLDRLELRVEIDEADVGRVALGQKGYATAFAYGKQQFPGHIARITRELGRKSLRTDDPRAKTDTRVLEVLFEIDGGAELALGLRMDVAIETIARKDVLTVPLSAIAKDGASVTVLENGQRAERAVKIGAEDGVRAEVLAGVTEGEQVALDP